MKPFFYNRSHWPTIEITGSDHLEFLNRLTTFNFKKILKNTAGYGCFLKQNASLIVKFQAILWGEKTWLFLEPEKETTLFELLSFYHFGERVEWKLVPHTLYEIRCDTLADFEAADPNLSLEPWGQTPGVLTNIQPKTSLLEEIFDEEYFDLRAYNLFPQDGRHIKEPYNILSFPSMSTYLSPNKGCYPGQEVVERLQSRDRTPFLAHRSTQLKESLTTGPILSAQNQRVGGIISLHRHPYAFALCMLQQNQDLDQNFYDLNGVEFQLDI